MGQNVCSSACFLSAGPGTSEEARRQGIPGNPVDQGIPREARVTHGAIRATGCGKVQGKQSWFHLGKQSRIGWRGTNIKKKIDLSPKQTMWTRSEATKKRAISRKRQGEAQVQFVFAGAGGAAGGGAASAPLSLWGERRVGCLGRGGARSIFAEPPGSPGCQGGFRVVATAATWPELGGNSLVLRAACRCGWMC